jgi:hypothetical protein
LTNNKNISEEKDQSIICSVEENNNVEFEQSLQSEIEQSRAFIKYLVSQILLCQQTNQANLYNQLNYVGELNGMEMSLFDTNLGVEQIKNLIDNFLKRYKLTNEELYNHIKLCAKYQGNKYNTSNKTKITIFHFFLI